MKKFTFPYRIKEEEYCSVAKRMLVLAVMLVLCFLLNSLIMAQVTNDPFKAYVTIIQGAFSSKYQVSQTLLRMLPIFLIGLGVSFCLKSGILNLGGNGSLLAGGIGAAWVGLTMENLPAPVAITLTVIVSMLFGAFWSGIAGYLKAKLNISEIYVTVMMNYVMLYFSSYLLEVVWRTPEKESWSEMISSNAKWPALLRGTPLHIGFIFAGLVFILVIFLNKTPLGFEIKAAGQNGQALQFKLKHRDYNFIIMFVMILSGALAGLAGAAQLCGNQYRFSLQLNQNFGFTGIVAARLGGTNPVGILVTSLLFGILSSGSTTMQVVTGVPASIADVLQGMLFVTAILADRIAMYKIVKVERGVAA